MCVLAAKFEVSNMVLTHFRQERGNFIPLPPHKPPQGEFLGSGPRLGLVGLWASAYSFIWEETLAQVFSCKFCEMFENTFFIEQLRWLLLCLVFFFLVPKHPCFLQRYLHWLCLARVDDGAGFMRLIFAWGRGGTLLCVLFWGGTDLGALCVVCVHLV